MVSRLNGRKSDSLMLAFGASVCPSLTGLNFIQAKLDQVINTEKDKICLT